MRAAEVTSSTPDAWAPEAEGTAPSGLSGWEDKGFSAATYDSEVPEMWEF